MLKLLEILLLTTSPLLAETIKAGHKWHLLLFPDLFLRKIFKCGCAYQRLDFNNGGGWCDTFPDSSRPSVIF